MAIKQLIKRTSGWLYLNSSVGRNQLHGAGVILMLHRVLADDASAELPHRNELCVGPQAFERLLPDERVFVDRETALAQADQGLLDQHRSGLGKSHFLCHGNDFDGFGIPMSMNFGKSASKSESTSSPGLILAYLLGSTRRPHAQQTRLVP